MAEKTQFEVYVLTIDTCSGERIITEAFDYYFSHNKVISEVVPSQRDYYADLGCYTLNVAEGL